MSWSSLLTSGQIGWLPSSPASRGKRKSTPLEEPLATVDKRFLPFQTDPAGYTKKFLGITPWRGVNEPGQAELFEDIGESVRQQIALSKGDDTGLAPGEPICKMFRVEAGHGVGKTYGAAGITNWFFDCFGPSITTTTAPTSEQVKLLLWKDIKRQRAHRGLPGRVLPEESRMVRADDWFAFGRTTTDAHGKGTERAQGQHHPYMLFVVDEAEGVPDFFFDAIRAMMTSGIVVIVLMLANPKTRTSRFHKLGKQTGVKNYRLSVLNHPNVVSGKELVQGATRREWAIEEIVDKCEVVSAHNSDENTFDLPWGFEFEKHQYPAGTIFRPNPEFCWRVLGIAPANLADKVFFAPGRYEQAFKNEPLPGEERKARIGIDCARFGSDNGAIYVRHAGSVSKLRQVSRGDTNDYVQPVKKEAQRLKDAGVSSLHVRVDGTGGFGAGIIDALRADLDLREWFRPTFDKPDADFRVFEVQFGSAAYSPETYADKATEMYGEAAESIKGLHLHHVPNELEADLCERLYDWVNREGRSLRKLQEKEKFRKAQGRSPDDGDGFVLAAAPDFIFVDNMLPPSHMPIPEPSESDYKPFGYSG